METAGFDVIGEVALDSIRDMVDGEQVTLPSGGDPFYLLGGPFLLELPVTLPNLPGTAQVRVFCEAGLEAVPRTPECRMTLTLSGGSVTSGATTVAHLGGTATATGSLVFAADTRPEALLNSYIPSVSFSSAAVMLALDTGTRSSVDSAFGSGMAQALEEGLQQAAQDWFRTLPQRTIDAMSFAVVPGVASEDPRQLSAVPQLMWIDADTLGVFGYYDAVAVGGDVSRKIDSDITQATQEFMYNQPGSLFPAVSARRLALIFSPRGFHQVVGCPILRRGVVRSLVEKTRLQEFIDQTHNEMFDQYVSEEEQKNLLRYWFEDKDLYAKSPVDALAKAKEHIGADAQGRVVEEARRRLGAWLDGPAGQAAIATATPPPCGTGTVQADRQHMPDPLGDVITTLRRLDVRLGTGFVDIEAQADGDLPLCGSYAVRQSTAAYIGVNSFGTVVTTMKPSEAQVDISKDPVCEVATAALLGLFVGPFWASVLSYVGFDLAASVGEKLIAQAISAKTPAQSPSYTPSLPAWAVLTDIAIDPSGVRSTALVARRQRFNDNRRRVELVPSLKSREPTGAPQPGRLHVEATSWGCPASDFSYTRSTFASVFAVKLIAVNLPLPVTVTGWRVDLGNFSYVLGSVRDPRPTWAGGTAAVTAPTTLLSGEVWHPEPPPKGAFTHRDDVSVGCSSENDMAWEFRFDGQDGNFYVRIDVDLTDGDGAHYGGSTFVTVNGDEIVVESAYDDWTADCERKFYTALKDAMDRTSPKVGQGHVGPGVAQEGGQVVVALAVQDALQRREPTAFAQLHDAVEQFGPAFIDEVGALPVHLDSPLLGQGPTDPVPWRRDTERAAEERLRNAGAELVAAARSLSPEASVALNPQPIPPGHDAGWASRLEAVQRRARGIGY